MRDGTKYNLFIWKTIDWTYVFLGDAFKYTDDETKKVWLKGLTGFELEFHTQEDADESLENLFDGEWFDFYIQYLQRTEDPNCTYYDRQEQVKSERDSDYDESYCNEKCVRDALEYANEKEWEDYEYTNCIWCWRHINEENTKAENYEYFIKENLEKLQALYKEYEE